MKWIPLSERKPTREDGDGVGEVLWRFFSRVDGTDASCVGKWDDPLWLEQSTHFARIRDIELPPPPAPVMPERIEYVKANPGENLGEHGIAVHNSDGYACRAEPNAMYTNYTLYRRVEPGKRVVFEVGEKKAPQPGEWYLTYLGGVPCFCVCDCPGRDPRTILRCVEGEEYLK